MVWAWQPPKCFQSSLSSHMQLFLEDPGHTMEVFHVPWSSYRSSHHEWGLPLNGYTNPRKWIDDRPQCFWSLKTCIVPLLEASHFFIQGSLIHAIVCICSWFLLTHSSTNQVIGLNIVIRLSFLFSVFSRFQFFKQPSWIICIYTYIYWIALASLFATSVKFRNYFLHRLKPFAKF